jgi:hypothetical protein
MMGAATQGDSYIVDPSKQLNIFFVGTDPKIQLLFGQGSEISGSSSLCRFPFGAGFRRAGPRERAG